MFKLIYFALTGERCQINQTPDDYTYQYVWERVPAGLTSFTFRVRATNDAHVTLSPIYGDAAQMYEIGE